MSSSDETRTSYLLQGVESAWDSAGRRKPPSQIQLRGSSSFLANQGAVGGASAASSSACFIPEEVRQPGEGGESPRGAEAMLDVPRKGNNVSFIINYCLFNSSSAPQIMSYTRLFTTNIELKLQILVD